MNEELNTIEKSPQMDPNREEDMVVEEMENSIESDLFENHYGTKDTADQFESC